MDDVERMLKEFHDQVAVPDPAIEQVFTGVREALRQIGIEPMDGAQARIALSVMTMYQSADETTRIAISAYLGSLIEIKEE